MPYSFSRMWYIKMLPVIWFRTVIIMQHVWEMIKSICLHDGDTTLRIHHICNFIHYKTFFYNVKWWIFLWWDLKSFVVLSITFLLHYSVVFNVNVFMTFKKYESPHHQFSYYKESFNHWLMSIFRYHYCIW